MVGVMVDVMVDVRSTHLYPHPQTTSRTGTDQEIVATHLPIAFYLSVVADDQHHGQHTQMLQPLGLTSSSSLISLRPSPLRLFVINQRHCEHLLILVS